MDEQTRERILAVRTEVACSDLPPEHKENLQRQLDHACKCVNNTDDKLDALCNAFADKAVRDVRHEVEADKRIRKVAKEEAHHMVTEQSALCKANMEQQTEVCKDIIAKQFVICTGNVKPVRPGLQGLADRLLDQYPTLTAFIMYALWQGGVLTKVITFMGGSR